MKKRILSVLLVVVMCVSLCACGGGEGDSGTDSAKGLVLKDFIENVEYNGTKWTEYSSKDVVKDAGIPNDSIKTSEVFYTDKDGKDHQAYTQWDDFTDSGRILQMYYGPALEYQAMTSFYKNADDEYFISDLSAEKQIYAGNTKEPLADDVHEAYIDWQGGVAPYLEENNVATIQDILVLWGIDKLDATAFEMAIDLESTENQEYEFVCESDYGEATIEVTNDYNEEVRRIEVRIVMRGEEDTYYINVYENYEPAVSEESASFFYVQLGKSIRLSE